MEHEHHDKDFQFHKKCWETFVYQYHNAETMEAPIDPDIKVHFAEDPLAVLKTFGLTKEYLEDGFEYCCKHPELDDKDNGRKRDKRDKLSVDVRWWGIRIDLDSDAVNDLIIGLDTLSGLGAFISASIGVYIPQAGILAAAITAAIYVKKNEFQVANRGEGVVIPISWVQILAVTSSALGGPAAIEAAVLAWIHPFPK